MSLGMSECCFRTSFQEVLGQAPQLPFIIMFQGGCDDRHRHAGVEPGSLRPEPAQQHSRHRCGESVNCQIRLPPAHRGR